MRGRSVGRYARRTTRDGRDVASPMENEPSAFVMTVLVDFSRAPLRSSSLEHVDRACPPHRLRALCDAPAQRLPVGRSGTVSVERDEPLKFATIVIRKRRSSAPAALVRDLNCSFAMHHLRVPGSVPHAQRQVVQAIGDEPRVSISSVSSSEVGHTVKSE